MCVPVHHDDDGKANANLCGGHYHDEEHKQLCINARCAARWADGQCFCTLHFGKSNQQQVHGIEHELDTHENDNDISAGQYSDDSYAKQDYGKCDVICYWHN